MKKLQLAKNLALPADEAVTQKYGFIGRSGSGKSYAAMKLAELFLGAGAQIIALDWVGIWWALRLAKSGKAPGFEHVYIFGGEHADVDLKPESGALMADLIVDKHISVVLDVMHFRKAERTRFATAFAEQFFHRKKTARTACHLFIEEAQAYLPQMVRGEEARMVGVFEDIGKVGRNYGIGNSLISQRPQAINKDVLNQVEVLLAFQTNGPQERKTIAGWTAENTTAGAAMVQRLPTLDVGHALVWSPQWLRIAQEAHIAERDTYNSSATPTQDIKTIAPKRLSAAELEDLGEAVKLTIETAKANDPKELKRQIQALKQEVAKKSNLQPAEIANVITPKTTPALTDADRALIEKLSARLAELEARVTKHQESAQSALDDKLFSVFAAFIEGSRDRAVAHAEEMAGILEAASVKKLLEKLNGLAIAPVPGSRFPAAPAVKQSVVSAPIRQVKDTSHKVQAPPAEGVTPIQQRIMNAIAEMNQLGVDRPAREVVGFLCNYSNLRSPGFANNISALRTSGLVDYPDSDSVVLTDAGKKIAQHPDTPTSAAAVQQRIMQLLGGISAKILEPLIEAYPKKMAREDVAARAGYTNLRSPGFANNISRLRTLGFVDYPDRESIVAKPVLFLEGR